MKITVIMGVYNPSRQKELNTAIRSILSQTQTDFEFLIVDDGSNVSTKEWLSRYTEIDSRIRIITKEKNKGLASALNTCIESAKGKYIARMDDDDISEPNRLEKQYKFLEANPEYAFVGTNAELIDDNGVFGIRKMPTTPKDKDFLPFSPFIHPSVMVRRDVYLECGGYEEGKETWRSEDYEIFMRMYAKGYRGYNLQEPLLQYREDRNSYVKRKYKYRIDEAKIRWRYFKGLDAPIFYKSIYVVKPLLVGLFPKRLIHIIKRMQGSKELYNEQKELMSVQEV